MEKKIIVLTLAILGLVGIIASINLHFIGIKNVDWGQNLKYLGGLNNLVLTDVNSQGIALTPTELIVMGFNQISNSFWGFGISCFVFGALSSLMIKDYLVRGQKKKWKKVK